MQQTIHELENPFDAYAKGMGYVLVKMMTIGSTSSNPQFLVRIYGKGDLRMVDQNDLKEYGNPAAGEPLVPYLPDDWLSKEDLEKRKQADRKKSKSDKMKQIT